MPDLIFTTMGSFWIQNYKEIVNIVKQNKNFQENRRGTLFPYLEHLDRKWKIGCNFQVPDLIFKTKGSLDAES